MVNRLIKRFVGTDLLLPDVSVTTQPVDSITFPDKGVYGVCFAPNNKKVAFAGGSRELLVLDLK